jgi:hypothetical protein
MWSIFPIAGQSIWIMDPYRRLPIGTFFCPTDANPDDYINTTAATLLLRMSIYITTQELYTYRARLPVDNT